MASQTESFEIEQALKRGARARRGARGVTWRPPISAGDLAPYSWPALLAIGAVLTFVVPEPTEVRRYSKDDVLTQIMGRRGEPIGSTPYILVNATPFPTTADDTGVSYDHKITIADGYYRATSAFKGPFVLKEGGIYPSTEGRVRLLNLEATGQVPANDMRLTRILPPFLKDMVNTPLVEGYGVNIKAAAENYITDVPIYWVPVDDRNAFDQNKIEEVERTATGFIVTYSDGISWEDMAYAAILTIGLLGTVGRFL